MLDHPIIDVAIGLIFFYVMLSLVCSSIQEFLASIFSLRSNCLEKGVINMVGKQYTNKIYDHPLINGLRKRGKLPSYIKPEILASALIEVVAKENGEKSAIALTTAEFRQTIEKIEHDDQTRDLLLSLMNRDEITVDGLKQRLAEWFDEGMDRISGWYKRKVKYFLLLIALVVTVSVNADSLRIAKQLWKDDVLRTAIAAKAEQEVSNDNFEEFKKEMEPKILETFPIGYSKDFDFFKNIFQRIVGWILTIAAISLGAPFWFDLLSKISHLRASGIKEANRAKNK